MIIKEYTVETWEIYSRKYVVKASNEEQAIAKVLNNKLEHSSEVIIDFDVTEVEVHGKDDWELDI